MKTYVFPGQGSQSAGMGGTLFDEFREVTEKADEVLGYSIKALCLNDHNKELAQTQFTQPAIYTVNALSYYKKCEETDQRPDFVAGHSLGEYNALLASGVFDFETGLRLVKKRGQLMSQARGGTMAAILGLNKEAIEKVIHDNQLQGIDVANYNTPSQIVISGLSDEISKAGPLFLQEGGQCIPLNTSGAFHSRYMQSARDEFAEFLAEFSCSKLTLPVVANVTARPYKQEDIRLNLANQMTHSVHWSESIRYLMGRGEMEFEEIGHGRVLKNMVAKIQRETTPLVVTHEENDITRQKISNNVTKQRQPDLVFMYSGQGSHYYQMGKELYQKNSVFRDAMNQCSAMLEPLPGKSLVDVIYNESVKHEVFDDILYTHPAIFCIGYSLTQVLDDMGIRPKIVLGYSLGEYVAAVVAGVMSLDDGLKLVAHQAKLLHEKCRYGGMLVILDRMENFDKNLPLFENCTFAGMNYEDNYVISGSIDTLKKVNSRLKDNGIFSQLLPVNHAFHSELINPIKNDFDAFANEINFMSPKIPIYSCAKGEEVVKPDKYYFWNVVREEIQFKKLVSTLISQEERLFVDLSPTGTLSNFIKYGFGKSVPSYYAINQFGQDLKTIDNLVVDLNMHSHAA
ncbi:MAG: ACP S-malonyltransferase [Gammaproteobacteria bacterium]|nr:ACP S-malonyltransferase [Gammaproteobacteria bacterium]